MLWAQKLIKQRTISVAVEMVVIYEAAVIDQKNKNFDGARDGGTTSVHQHNNTFGGELIECGSSDYNREIVDGVNETSKKDG